MSKSQFRFSCRWIQLLVLTLGAGHLATAQQAPVDAKAPAAANQQFTVKTRVPKTLMAVHTAPSGSPSPDLTCILEMNTSTPSKPHTCKPTSGGGNAGDGPASTQCGTTCSDAGTVPNTCSGTDDTDPEDCGQTSTALCQSDYTGCYPGAAPGTSGLTDPANQNTDPDSLGGGDSPTSGASFCQLEQAGLSNSCAGYPAGVAKSDCVYAACVLANQCVGVTKQTCIKPPKAAAKAVNDTCQAQYVSNMSYCSAQKDIPTQTICITTSRVELNACSRVTGFSVQLSDPNIKLR
jgi:hypothetical protein